MNMLHGKVIVEAPDDGDGPAGEDSEKLSEGEGDRPRRPVTDRACAHFSLLGSLSSLPTRVADIEAGAVLTVPVLYAAMVGHFLGEHLVPDLLTALTERR